MLSPQVEKSAWGFFVLIFRKENKMAIKTYKKDTAEQLSANFKSTEFDCHGSGCCSSTLIDEKLIDYL